ncbi:MAG: hypothetical protein QOJ19_938 [Acidimicrobiia bacterium]|nr:hypothetical protein [Acidimicrobiia bacterium]
MRAKRAVLTALAVLLSGGVAGSVAMAGVERSDKPPPAWLDILNSYRATAGLRPVDEVPAWSSQAADHARYQVLNGHVTPEEQPDARAASPGGAEAARNANLAGVAGPNFTDRQAMDMWMASPFHALGMLRPRLQRVGYGKWSEPRNGPLQASAVLDVLRGLGPSPDRQQAVSWPGPDSTVPLNTYAGTEIPDPLTSCPGYTSPAGLPVLTLFPAHTPVSESRVDVDGQTVESCLITSANYANSDSAAQERGRDLLAADHATVVVPRRPLPVGSRVRVALETRVGELSWSFNVGRPDAPISAGRPQP